MLANISADLSVSLLLERGKYHFIHSFITDRNFPDAHQSVIGVDAMRVISIDRDMKTEWIKNLVHKKGFYPATIYHLLYYAAMNPQMPFKTPIVALGTIVDFVEEPFPPSMKKPHCAGLHDMSQRRGINLASVEGKWGRGVRFLTYVI